MKTRQARQAAGVVACALVLAAGSAAADTPDALDALLHSIAARRHAHAAFTEVQYRGLLDRPHESSGELRFDAPAVLDLGECRVGVMAGRDRAQQRIEGIRRVRRRGCGGERERTCENACRAACVPPLHAAPPRAVAAAASCQKS